MGWYGLTKPLLFALEAEQAHKATFAAIRAATALPGVLPLEHALFGYDHPVLHTRLWGREVPNPLGLAAGFDKNGVLVEGLLGLGFGFIELGTVTPLPQPGNPRPRLFRLPQDQAIINRMGFNNEGAYAMAQRLSKRLSRPQRNTGLVGVNLGKNKDTPLDAAGEDYLMSMHAVYAYADYLVINISSPNTPGLRNLQHKTDLATLCALLVGERQKLAEAHGNQVPLLVKLAPDLTDIELDQAVEVALETGLDGVIACNTTLGREGLHSPLAQQPGGLSGKPLLPRTLAVVGRIREVSQGRLPIVGVGGVSSAQDAYALIRAGASAVQIYSALIYQGPALVKRIKKGLAAQLRQDGFASVADAVGAK